MGKEGSVRTAATLPVSVAPLAVLGGLAGMVAAGRLAAPLGLRGILIASELALALPALALLVRPGARAALGWRPVPWRTGLLGLACGASLWAVSLGLLELQYTVWPPPPGYLQDFQRIHDALRPGSLAGALLSLAAIALGPAVCEELLFRGVVLASLRARLGTAAAVAGSALLFGAIHLDWSGSGPTLYRVPFAVAVGTGFGMLRVGTGSLLPPMLAHFLVNATTFFAALQQRLPETLPDPRPALGLALLLAGGSALAWLLSLTRSERDALDSKTTR